MKKEGFQTVANKQYYGKKLNSNSEASNPGHARGCSFVAPEGVIQIKYI